MALVHRAKNTLARLNVLCDVVKALELRVKALEKPTEPPPTTQAPDGGTDGGTDGYSDGNDLGEDGPTD